MSASTRSSAVMLHIRDMKSADSASLCACASSRSCRSRISSARSTEQLISLLLQHLRQMVDRSVGVDLRSEEHTSELQSLMSNSYAVFCLNKTNNIILRNHTI